MRVFLDDELLAPDGAAESLAGALDLARDRAQSLGRLIVEVWADGLRVPGEDLSGEHPLPSPYASELRLVSESPRALVRSALVGAAAAVDEIKTAQQRAADSLLSGDTVAGVESLRDALDLWESVRRALGDGASILGFDPRSPGVAGNVAGLLSELSVRLQEVGRLMQSRDWSALADELAFELSDHAEAWRAGLLALAGTLE